MIDVQLNNTRGEQMLQLRAYLKLASAVPGRNEVHALLLEYIYNTLTRISWPLVGFRLVVGFIEHSEKVTANNDYVFTILHTVSVLSQFVCQVTGPKLQ
jgi:hypothetical protein